MDVAHPRQESILKSFRIEGNFFFCGLIFDRTLSQWLHFDEPLRRDARFHNNVCAFRMSDTVGHFFNFDQIAQFFHIFYDRFARCETVHTCIFSGCFVHRRVIVHDIHLRQVMTQTDFKVVRVMSRCYFYDTGPEVHFDIIIRNDRDFPIHERQSHGLADELLISFIFRMNRYGSISKHRFRTGSSQLQVSRTIRHRIAEVIEGALDVLMDNFNI